MMSGIESMGLGGALIAIAAMAVWILVLVWLGQRVLRFIGLRTSWKPLDPRNLLLTFAMLTGAIHLGNYALDWIESWMRDGALKPVLTFPGAFLIGSVAVGVGIAAIHWHRQQKKQGQ